MATDDIGRCTVDLTNEGVGAVLCTFQYEYPNLAIRPQAALEIWESPDGRQVYVLPPGPAHQFEISLPIDEARGQRYLGIDLQVWDDVQEGSVHGRSCSPPPPRTIQLGPEMGILLSGELEQPPDLLVFPRRLRKGQFCLRNLGETELTATVGPIPPGFEFTTDTEALHGAAGRLDGLSRDGHSLEATMPGGGERWITLLAPSLDQVWNKEDADLKVRVGDDREYSIHMYREPLLADLTEEVRWILGIDFGTHESRVYASPGAGDVERRDPVSIAVGPSTLAFRESSPDRPQCGVQHDLLAGYDASVAGMKLELLSDDDTREILGRSWTIHELVSVFLRHLANRIEGELSSNMNEAGQMEADEELDGSDILGQSHCCLAIPAMPTLERRQLQEERTKAAARSAMPAATMSAHLEPDCAALDFIHHRRQPGYEDFDPQDQDYICIFDCGAGTTDISILRYSVQGGGPGEEGAPADDEVHLDFIGATGCEHFGGNVIDRLLTRAVLWKLAENPGFVRGLSDERVEEWVTTGEAAENRQDDLFEIEGEEGLQRHLTDVAEDVRVPKEGLYRRIFTSPPGEERTTAVYESRFVWPQDAKVDDAIRAELSFDEIEETLRPWLDMVLETGRHPMGGKTFEIPLQKLLDDCGLHRSDIRWCCMTGGSSLVASVEMAVGYFFDTLQGGSSGFKLIRPPIEDVQQNVGRGASLRHQYRIEGRLPCSIHATVTSLAGGKEGQPLGQDMLLTGTPDGTKAPTWTVGLPFGHDVVFALGVDYGGGIQGDVYRKTIALSGGERHRIRIGLEYRESRVYLTARAGPEEDLSHVVGPDLVVLTV